ncbi:VOC family protein [Nakamurella flavida]|uniref:VOC family protein n=1 Tax=Nakamurella flavida TaxID=363630 RepID=A0A938YPP4_9ACTN|nr:VOC family protein [Nakamurella flavida]MBM9476695.1 VOC family protein [Nakamurella flavida]MDP9778867.1 catechol 2,3-dioxygenase-like lactoylglutathione lyase family enzyme [Nakamurella flavida]
MTSAAQPDPAPIGTLASVSLNCPEPAVLADFYTALLGMRRVFATPDGRLVSLAGATGPNLTLMQVDDYAASTWPDPERPQQIHLDIAVAQLDVAVARAEELGATQAVHQAGPQMWRVLLDPVGHPFCLTTATGG